MNQFWFLAVTLLTIGALPSLIVSAPTGAQPFPFENAMTGAIKRVTYASDEKWPCFIVMEATPGNAVYFASNNLKNCEVAEQSKESSKNRIPTTVYVRQYGQFKIAEAVEVILSDGPNYNPYPPKN